ncbi:MAG: peptidoglycan DD-metalloendopeptidase family protein [Fermentimonas sp.]|nr:peptidoglycan DD-metalloendopeptidase family protein [Fermentimonas sp.]
MKKWTIFKEDKVTNYENNPIELNKDLRTWLISAKKRPQGNKATSYEYYYTYDNVKKIEIWAYSNPSDTQHDKKSIFVRTYNKPGLYSQRLPDNDGFTLTHPVFTDSSISTSDAPISDGFDFPVGAPDGKNYSHGITGKSGTGWDFLEYNGEVFHPGEDWNGKGGGDSDFGHPVYAVSNGRVIYAANYTSTHPKAGWGNIVLIEHKFQNGTLVWSQYAHLNNISVNEGNTVRRGQQIGTIGKGAKNYPAHLHFEIRKNNLTAGAWPSGKSKEEIHKDYFRPSEFINATRPQTELDKAEETVKTRDTVLVLDASGSMSGTPMSEMKEAAKIFCSDVLAASGKNRVAIVVYESSVKKTLDFTSDQNSLNSTIDSISAGGVTNTGAAIDSASSMLSSSDADIKNIVLLTDGLPNSGSYRWSGKYSSSDISSYYLYANYVYERCSDLKQSYNIYTLGFFHSSYGRELDFGRKFLNDIQNKGYYDVTDASNLKFVFEELAEDITEEDYPIIIVHGVMGGKLYDGDDLVWVDEGKVKTFKAKLGRLANDLNTPENGMNLNALGIEREYGVKDYYRELVDDLCEEFPNRSIYFYSYDWRKSNKDSAAGLNNLINDVKAQTGYSKVDLVCHSMGGLVASNYVKQYDTNDVRYIITLATPYEGSPDIISRTLDERALGSDAKLSGWFLAINGLTKEIMAGIPSSSELVPTERYFKSTNFLKIGNKHLFSRTDEDITYDNYCNIMSSIFGNKNYDSAVTFQSSTKDVLLNLDNTYFAVGTGIQTVDTVFINKEESLDKLKVIELTYNNRGDGTVPYESSTMNGPLLSYKNVKDSSGNTRYREFNADHTGILSHSGALLWIKSILSQKSNPYEESDKINYRGYTVVRIACPIDVTIDVNGEILSSGSESGSTYVSNGRLDFIGDGGVSICLEDTGTVYDINIVGTGEGTMDYNISWYDANNTLTETRSLESVPITTNTLITTTTDNTGPTVLNIDSDGDGVLDTKWSVDASGETVVVDLDQGTSSILLSPENLSIEGKAGGQITGNFTVSTSQDSASVTITPTSLKSEIGDVIDTGNIKIDPTTVNVSAGVAENILITVDVPESATSGNYTGKIIATGVGGSASCTVDLRVTKDAVISDVVAPVINSVDLYPANPTPGSLIAVTVNATDDVGVSSVKANDISLHNQGGNLWKGDITALEGTHSVNVSAVDEAGNIAWDNSTSYTALKPGNLPPSSINLQSTKGTTWINWTWTNPTDPNFSYFEIYLDGVFQTNASAEYFNATDLEPETSYTIGMRDVDINGNINQTWVNQTVTTEKEFVSGIEYPMADFTTNVSEGHAPLTVQFNDRSENAVSFNWSFGDGTSSTEKNPVYTYSTAGAYTVKLTVSNENGTDSKLATINVLETEGKKVCEKPNKVCKPICEEAKPTCKETRPICNKETKPVCKVTKPICKETKPPCKETKPICKETKPICNKETKPVCKVTKPICKETISLNKETEKISEKTKPVCKDTKKINEITEKVNEKTKKASENSKQVSEEAKEISEEAKEASEEAKEASEEAKEINEEAKEASEEAKEASEEAKEASEEAKEINEEAKEISEEAKEASEEAKEISENTEENTEETSKNTGEV